MKALAFYYLALSLSCLPLLTSHALKIPFSRVKQDLASISSLKKRSGTSSFKSTKSAVNSAKFLAATSSSSSSDSLTLDDVRDLIYIANVTLGGNDYPVQLDTGSSDLWIKGKSSPLPNTNPSSTSYNLTYGIGWANGTISYAPVEFAGISVSKQAFLDVSSAQNPALTYGANGILGLGFTSLSTIDALLNETKSSSGRSLLYNLFEDNPSEPNFIAFSLQSTSDPNATISGSFSIGEYESNYTAVANTSAIPTWPVNSPTRWNILLEALLTPTGTVPVSTNVTDAPGNRAVVLMDSGTSWTYAPVDICAAIYGNISGAYLDENLSQWVVPCDAEVDVALQFDGRVFPIHPLDMTPKQASGSSTCVGSFVPQSVSVGEGEFDWLIGDNVLRSIYSVYDFGEFSSGGSMGNPYMKLLALTDPNVASVEFHNVRGGSPSSSSITYTPSTASAAPPAVIAASADVQTLLNKLTQYLPAVLAIMGLNALALVLILVAAIVYLCCRRKRRNTARTRQVPGRLNLNSTVMEPMPMNPIDGTPDGTSVPHEYQPVSMAFSESDPFNGPNAASVRASQLMSPGIRASGYSIMDNASLISPTAARNSHYAQSGLRHSMADTMMGQDVTEGSVPPRSPANSTSRSPLHQSSFSSDITAGGVAGPMTSPTPSVRKARRAPSGNQSISSLRQEVPMVPEATEEVDLGPGGEPGSPALRRFQERTAAIGMPMSDAATTGYRNSDYFDPNMGVTPRPQVGGQQAQDRPSSMAV